jgi:phage antirepressor YoqD-like protein
MNDIEYKVDWRPLEELARNTSLDLGDFMYMGTIGTINLYKHRITRNYINIDNNNNCYKYNHVNGEYITIKTTQAVYNVLS